MSTSMWQGRILMSAVILVVLAMICERTRAVPATLEMMPQAPEQEQQLLAMMTTTEMATEESESESELESESQPDRIDCKLTLDATMDNSLEQQQQRQQMLLANGCKPAVVLQEPKEQQLPAKVLRHTMADKRISQPLYELQVVVWPADIGDSTVDAVPVATSSTTSTPSTTTTTTTVPTTTTTPTSTTTMAPSLYPLYEDQLVVFPQMDFEEENFDYFFDELEPSTSRPATTARPSTPVYVVENYRMKHPNGTEEHKLVLSNGLVNYMKIYRKHVNDKVINVQEGYSSMPVAGLPPRIETLHYIADERGYNVQRIEKTALPLRQVATVTGNKPGLVNLA